MKKPILIFTLRLLTAYFFSLYMLMLLGKYDYFDNFHAVDNIVGMLPVAFIIVAILAANVVIWFKYLSLPKIYQYLAALVWLLTITLFPTALHGNWWLNLEIQTVAETKLDLSAFQPFSESPKLARLSEESELVLSENLPRLDGATGLFPLYAAFADAVFDPDVTTSDLVSVSSTRQAYEALFAGETDILFVVSMSNSQRQAAYEAGLELHETLIGREAFVFLAGAENPIDNLSFQQIQNIYSGKTAYWETLGWPEGGRIINFMRPDGSGSQSGLEHFMWRAPIQAPQPLPDPSLIGNNSLMNQVSLTYNGVQPALGYSYRFFATNLLPNPDAKLLSIDGVYPSLENIQNWSYPLIVNIYAVTVGKPNAEVKAFLDWILSPQGQSLVEKTGYAPLPPDEAQYARERLQSEYKW